MAHHMLRTVASSVSDIDGATPPSSKLDLRALDELNDGEIIELLNEADSMEDQGALVHYLWMNKCASSLFYAFYIATGGPTGTQAYRRRVA